MDLISCKECKNGMAITADKYYCSADCWKRSKGKIIYPDTFKILVKVGCMTGDRK